MNMKKNTFVMVTTKHRGVFSGKFVKKNDTGDITLAECRNCIRWSSQTKGVFGLASKGPNNNCKIGPAVPEVTIVGITSTSVCTKEAQKAWELEPWG